MDVLLHGAVSRELIFDGGQLRDSYRPPLRKRISHGVMREICGLILEVVVFRGEGIRNLSIT